MKIHDSGVLCLLLSATAIVISGCAAHRSTSPLEAVQIQEPQTALEVPGYLSASGQAMLSAGNLDQAEDRGRAWDAKLLAGTARMEIHKHFKGEMWVKNMEEIWKKLRKRYPRTEEATFLMGRVYLEEKEYLKASVCFRQILDWNGPRAGEADRLLGTLYKQLLAEPGTAAGRRVAQNDRLSRGDFAVLIVQELKLPEYLAAGEPKKYNSGFKTPKEFSEEVNPNPVPPDIIGHPFECDIKAALNLKMRGLTPFPDGLFHPSEPLSRAGLALIIEDILALVKGETLLKTAFLGNESPFSDVSSDHYGLNAIVVCTTRNLIAADLDGAFRPDDPATGAECLLAVRRLREEIKSRQISYRWR